MNVRCRALHVRNMAAPTAALLHVHPGILRRTCRAPILTVSCTIGPAGLGGGQVMARCLKEGRAERCLGASCKQPAGWWWRPQPAGVCCRGRHAGVDRT